jgi:hypothetical protein
MKSRRQGKYLSQTIINVDVSISAHMFLLIYIQEYRSAMGENIPYYVYETMDLTLSSDY